MNANPFTRDWAAPGSVRQGAGKIRPDERETLPMIDFCCDIGNYAFRDWPVNDVAGTVRVMDGAGIRLAVAGSVDAIAYACPHPANVRFMAALQASGHQDRFVPVTVLSPVYPGVAADMADSRSRGCRGLKLYPGYHGFHVDDPPALRLIRQAADWGWPVIVTLRIEDERHHHPLMKVRSVPVAGVVAAALQVPQATVILSGATHGEVCTFLEATAALPRAGAELSYVKGPLGALKSLVDRFGSKRLLLGTHLPFVYPGCGIAKIAEADLPAAAKGDILSRNAAALLGLPA